jgi:hypothetical protein
VAPGILIKFMSDQQIQITEQVVEQKRSAWGKMGIAIYNKELSLQAKSQEIIATLVLPTEFERIPQAEEILKVAKQNTAAIEEERKTVTTKLNSVIDRLMLAEKAATQKTTEFANGLLQLKKRAKEWEIKEQQKVHELKQIAEKVRLYIADINAALLNEFSKFKSDSYEYALANIKPQDLPAYLTKVKARLTVKKYTINPPNMTAQFNTQDVVDAEVLKTFNPKPAAEYIEGFIADIDLKFNDYKLAWDNKEQALQLNKQESQEDAEAIAQQKQQETVAANIQAMASTPSVGYGGKSLNEVFKLAMEETFEHANIIIMAYLTNAEKCRDEIRVTKWLTGFGVKQMISALEKIKNDDNKFDFNGLKWTKEDKL